MDRVLHKGTSSQAARLVKKLSKLDEQNPGASIDPDIPEEIFTGGQNRTTGQLDLSSLGWSITQGLGDLLQVESPEKKNDTNIFFTCPLTHHCPYACTQLSNGKLAQ